MDTFNIVLASILLLAIIVLATQWRNRYMKYKIGDKVRIKSIDWYNQHKDETDDIECSNNIYFYREMSKFCGKVMTISHVRADHYTMVEDLVGYWTDEMIEGLVEEESSIDLTVKGEEVKERIEITIPEGYEYVIESGKIIFTKKKKEYPKTYMGCCDTLYINSRHDECYEACLQGHPMQTFARLLICRDAYWKLYGEEMGLGKPWEPDWSDYENIKYIIGGYDGEIGYDQNHHIHKILAFPTEEMRYAFYENFKEEIEICKELL